MAEEKEATMPTTETFPPRKLRTQRKENVMEYTTLGNAGPLASIASQAVRVFGWAKLAALAEGAVLATKTLWQ
jgi:hypothetical protein